MRVSILTIFPDFFPATLAEGMIRAAREKGRLQVDVVGLRDFTDDPHRTTDDYPFGGGVGMIMKIEPIDRALASLGIGPRQQRTPATRVVLFSPQGRRFTQDLAIEYARLEHLVLLCGRYKGVDERVAAHLVDEELSIGDFVLAGGEPAALCVTDAVARLQPDVVGTFDSVESDSFHSGLLDCAYYTRPAEYKGWGIPDVLLSGHHANVATHRRQEALRRTYERRPDLLTHAQLAPEDRRFLAGLERERKARAADAAPAPAPAPAREDGARGEAARDAGAAPDRTSATAERDRP